MFTNHLSKYPEFVTQEQLVPLDDTLTEGRRSTSSSTSRAWPICGKGQDGKRYGLPKDFDTVALFYNKKLIADGGVDEAEPAAT